MLMKSGTSHATSNVWLVCCTHILTILNYICSVGQTKHQKLSQIHIEFFCLIAARISNEIGHLHPPLAKYVLHIPQAAQSGAMQSAGASLFVASLLLVTVVALNGY